MSGVTILGINAFHGDASAALVVDGQLVAAVEEERFNRIKHWAGFPAQSINYCLDFGGIKASDLDHVAISTNPRANMWPKLRFLMQNRPSLQAVFDRFKRRGKTLDIFGQFATAVGLSREEVRAEFHFVEHHDAHVGAGFLISPFDEAAILSVDGMGDFTSNLTAYGNGNRWNEISRVFYPHSIGFLYTCITMYLGFPFYGDEYKVMGLAPYGEPEFADFFRKMIRCEGDGFRLDLSYFTHHKRGIKMEWNDGAPTIEPFYSEKLIKELGPARLPKEEMTRRHDNIAKSLQVVTEEVILHMLRALYQKTKSKNVCLTGGCAMNSVANGKVTTETEFENVYVPAGAADNGTSFGAAFQVWNCQLGNRRSFTQNHAYWGWESSEAEIVDGINGFGLPFRRLDDQELAEEVTEKIIKGLILGWFQGRMEFGARALGNRSLIADPRREDMRDIINLRIKFREKFRPFAPSILEERVADWFEIDEKAPYMEKVFPIRKDRRALIPAVTHVDGSGRLQTVSKTTNPKYHHLIETFFKKTGVPILLNTSLNENEPIVRTPKEALSCFLRTDMDILVLGNYVIDRAEVGFPEKYRKRTEVSPN